MKYPESILINLGFKFEKCLTTNDSRIIANDIRTLLNELSPEDQTEARRLIEVGRKEARLN